MLITSILRRISKEQKDVVEWGLASGFILSLAISGLVALAVSINNVTPNASGQITITPPIDNIVPIIIVFLILNFFLGLVFDGNMSTFYVTSTLTGIGIIGFISGLYFGVFQPSWVLIAGIIIAEEVLFWLDEEKRPHDENIYWFTITKKLEAFVDVGFGLGFAALGYLGAQYKVFQSLAQAIVDIVQGLVEALGIIIPAVAIVAIIVGAIIAFILGNSLKYRNGRNTAPPPPPPVAGSAWGTTGAETSSPPSAEPLVPTETVRYQCQNTVSPAHRGRYTFEDEQIANTSHLAVVRCPRCGVLAPRMRPEWGDTSDDRF